MLTDMTRNTVSYLGLSLLLVSGVGCTHSGLSHKPSLDLPRELNKTAYPSYRIEPPDVLEINSLQTIPLSPYKIRALDSLFVRVPGAFKEKPIAGVYPVDPDGTLDLGFDYGKVTVAGLSKEEAEVVIEDQLKKSLKEENADVYLADTRATQQIRGRHLVRSDGMISLGEYGSVMVTGLTLREAESLIEMHLKQYLQDPDITIDVLGFNSKVYYVILDGGGYGQQLYRLPATGNETVLDALCQINGLGSVSDPCRIFLSRPGPDGCQSSMPIDWKGLTERGETRNNYQIFPGDRIVVKAYPMVKIDSAIARLVSPFERLFGAVLLGQSTVQSFSNNVFGGNTSGN